MAGIVVFILSVKSVKSVVNSILRSVSRLKTIRTIPSRLNARSSRDNTVLFENCDQMIKARAGRVAASTPIVLDAHQAPGLNPEFLRRCF